MHFDLKELVSKPGRISSVEFLKVKELMRNSYQSLLDPECGPKSLLSLVSKARGKGTADKTLEGETDELIDKFEKCIKAAQESMQEVNNLKKESQSLTDAFSMLTKHTADLEAARKAVQEHYDGLHFLVEQRKGLDRKKTNASRYQKTRLLG